jgi:molybdopterin molybdotransferase
VAVPSAVKRKPLPPDDALRLVLRHVCPLEIERLPVRRALRRVLAEDVASSDDVPGFDNSAMDGFAVRAADTRGAGGETAVRLEVVSESRAGSPAPVPVGDREAIRISTGAMLPAGADAIVRVEDTVGGEGSVEVYVEVPPGKEVRRSGEDIRAGDIVLGRGTLVGPAELGVLASIGAADVTCHRRPTVSVLTTGDELVEPGRPLRTGQIRNSNAYSLPAQVLEAGGEVSMVETVPDDLARTKESISGGLQGDVLICCGGVSVGEHDHVKKALGEAGVEEVFWGVALRPGRPTWFGVHRRKLGEEEGRATLVFGLPGNPVSAMVTFHLFVLPALAGLQGASLERRKARAIMDESYAKQAGRAHVVRCRAQVRADGWHVQPTKDQGSHVLTSMLGADALALLEVDRGDVAAGEQVEIELL